MSAIQDQCTMVYARGAMPWNVFIQQAGITKNGGVARKVFATPGDKYRADIAATQAKNQRAVLKQVAAGVTTTARIAAKTKLAESTVHMRLCLMLVDGSVVRRRDASGTWGYFLKGEPA